MTPPTPSIHILLVDDDARNLVVLAAILESPEYRLIQARTADDALRAVLTHDFAAIVLDIQMPDMNGLDLAQLIKQRKRSHDIPIIFLTAYLNEETDVLRGYGAGAVDYLTKPVNSEILRSKVAVFVDLFRKTRQLAEQHEVVVRANAEAQEARRLAEARAEGIEQASRFKSNFLATMSHELRTPLNGIIGFAELLVDERPGPLLPKQKEYLNDVLTSAHHLLQLINDVLDLAKIEGGKTELHPVRFSLVGAIAEVRTIIEGSSRKKGVVVRIAVDEGLDTVTLDPQKFKQVLYNLLSNAVKFTDQGGEVDVHACRLDSERIAVAVRDTGIGIRAEDVSRLFTEFEQLESGTGRRFDGTGLGLALTKKIVELHGGHVRVQSEPGRGSVFTVEFPVPTEP
ncbi:MAG: ATP-binding protein [Proteobacteria bacterium]|nr:ATP-binding protein [Pseudomonadota bacterium]